MSETGDYLKQLREARGLSKADGERACRLYRYHVWHIETGRRVPGPELAARLADYYALTGEERAELVRRIGQEIIARYAAALGVADGETRAG